MHGRRSIRVPTPTSEQLIAALPRLQDALCGLFPSLHRVRVRQEAVGEPPAPADRGAGILLSLDVDSFYSLLILRKVLTHVVLVHGFDIALENETLWAHAVAAAEEVAAWTDTHVVLVRTNVRALLDRHVDWELGRGAALAHVALTLSPWLRRVTIPSSHRREPYLPRGSHPDVDGLWSTELQEVVHHGAGVRRIDTLAYLAHEREALDHLRVCRVPGVSQLNCGRCAQCLLAMLGLEVVGGLAHAHTLPRTIPDDALRGIDAWSPAERMELEALRDAWREERPGSRTLSEIEAAIGRALADES
jgi:hypothetical protein